MIKRNRALKTEKVYRTEQKKIGKKTLTATRIMLRLNNVPSITVRHSHSHCTARIHIQIENENEHENGKNSVSYIDQNRPTTRIERNRTEPNSTGPNERTNEFLIFETYVCYTQSLFCIDFQSDCISVAPNELTMQKCSLHCATNINCGWIVVLLNVIHCISP